MTVKWFYDIFISATIGAARYDFFIRVSFDLLVASYVVQVAGA
jgi:hypothetical protein